jgi:hypothetical protein
MGYHPGEGIPLVAVKKMGGPVNPDSVKARVTEEYLKKILGSRIPFGNGLNVFF